MIDKDPSLVILSEAAVSNEAVEPIVNEADRLMAGVLSATDEVKKSENPEDGIDTPGFVVSFRSAMFPVIDKPNETLLVDQIYTPGGMTTMVHRVEVKQGQGTEHQRGNVTQLYVVSNSHDEVVDYDYIEKRDVNLPDNAREAEPGERVELTNQDTVRTAISENDQPKLTRSRLQKILDTLAGADIDHREIQEGSEELTINL